MEDEQSGVEIDQSKIFESIFGDDDDDDAMLESAPQASFAPAEEQQKEASDEEVGERAAEIAKGSDHEETPEEKKKRKEEKRKRKEEKKARKAEKKKAKKEAKKAKKAEERKARKERGEVDEEEESSAASESSASEGEQDEEDGGKKKRKRLSKKKDKKKSKKGKGSDEEEEEDEEASKASKPKRQRKSRKQAAASSSAEGAEGGGAAGGSGEGGLVADAESDDEKSRKNTEFDEMLQGLASRRRHKTVDLSMEQSTKDRVHLLLEKMNQCYLQDRESNKNGQPAIAKLKLMPEVADDAQKLYMQGTLVEQGLLVQLSRWLEPLPDNSMPNPTLRSQILELLSKIPCENERAGHDDDEENDDMEVGPGKKKKTINLAADHFEGISKDHLKSSLIAKFVNVLVKDPRETPENRKMAHKIIERWSRLVFALETSYTAMVRHQARHAQDYIAPLGDAIRQEGDDKKLLMQEQFHDPKKSIITSTGGSTTFRARIPQPAFMDYVVQPKANHVEGVEKRVLQGALSRIDRKLNELDKPMKKNKRAMDVNVVGKL